MKVRRKSLFLFVLIYDWVDLFQITSLVNSIKMRLTFQAFYVYIIPRIHLCPPPPRTDKWQGGGRCALILNSLLTVNLDYTRRALKSPHLSLVYHWGDGSAGAETWIIANLTNFTRRKGHISWVIHPGNNTSFRATLASIHNMSLVVGSCQAFHFLTSHHRDFGRMVK